MGRKAKLRTRTTGTRITGVRIGTAMPTQASQMAPNHTLCNTMSCQFLKRFQRQRARCTVGLR